MRIIHALVFTTLISLAWSCGGGSSSAASSPAAEETTQATTTPGADTMVAPPANFHSVLEKTSWVLVNFTYEGESFFVKPEQAAITLDFNRGLMSSLGNCYRLSANYATTNEGTITLTNFASRQENCPVEEIGLLRRYMAVMSTVNSFKVLNGNLTLTGPGGLVVFK